MPDKVGSVLVVGAGAGGIRAALDLAESGFKVYLVDRNPSVGGTIAQLDKWFPDNQCEMCKLLPVFFRDECSQFCLFRNIAHPNIELISNTRIEKVQGDAGSFEVSLKIEPGWVKSERCTGCGLCAGVCPVEVPDEFNEGLRTRKAIYLRNPKAIPNFYVIDRDHCTECGKCVEICPTNAIDLKLAAESRELPVGAIIVSTGFEEFDAAQMGQYGFGRHPNVVNNIQLERLLSPGESGGGELVRPSDGKAPQKVAFLQCVGSRDMKRNYCSSACCMYALKEAIMIKEQNPKIEVTIFYMDLRAFGKGYHRYYLQAKDLGINFTRCRISRLRENPRTKNLLLLARAEDGDSISSEFDLVVLSVAQCPSPHTAEMSQVLGVGTNKWGFIESHGLQQIRTDKEGIYVCGSATAPADISETVIQSSAAACEASILLSSARNQLVSKKTKSAEPAAIDEDAKIAIFVCHCGQEIASVVDTEQVATFARDLPGVIHVEDVPYLCLSETLDKAKQAIVKSGANRVILAACTPYHYRRLFGEALQEIGLDSSLWQLVNFREQIAWVHQDSQAPATEKAQHVLAMASEQLKGQELLPIIPAPVNSEGLVIGGGISGLVAALCLARQGFEVHLVEKSAELGGHTRDVQYSLDNEDPQDFLNSICAEIKDNPKIHLYMETEVVEMTGHAGSFQTRVKTGEEISSIEHGTAIIATGAKDYQPTEYLYGQDDRIITQKELQKRLAERTLEKPSTVVMIQCVGSRDSGHPYCNRTCCSEAIINAIKIKEQSPETEVLILNRDIMSYGFKEEYYTQAREAGVLFVRYELGAEPEVGIENKTIVVQVDDPALSGRLEIEADLLVLSTGIVPGDNSELAKLLSLELTEDGFFQEVDTKFRPVDSLIDGIFICGLASAPRNLDEEVVQAQAAAQRAAVILAKEHLESGRIVSEVNVRKCSACGLCVTTCPYNARWMDEELKVAVVQEALCQGCGVCVATCPNSAAKLRGLKEKQVFSMIEAAW
ncbi:FAD-dependent oxidoreductase [Chloroflexota bacterium]